MFFQYIAVPEGDSGAGAVRAACADENRPILALCFAPGTERHSWLEERAFIDPIRIACEVQNGTIVLAPGAGDDAFFTLGATLNREVNLEERDHLTELWGQNPILILYAGRLGVSAIGGLETLSREQLQRLVARLVRAVESQKPFDEVVATQRAYRVKHFCQRHQPTALRLATQVVKLLSS